MSIWKNLDRIHLLSYDHEGRHSTLEDAQRDVEAVIRAGAPAWKIQLGVPFYGRSLTDWKAAMGYSEIVRQFAPKAYADEAGGFWFNGPETLRAKVDLAREMSLGGVVVWEIGQDAVGEGSLLKQLVAFARPTGASQPRPEPKPITPKANKSEKANKTSKPSRSAPSARPKGAKSGEKSRPKT